MNDNYLFLWCDWDWVEYYLRRWNLMPEGDAFFRVYSWERVFDMSAGLESRIENDELLADLEEIHWPLVTRTYINNKRDLLINHYFYRIPWIDDIYFWSKPKIELRTTANNDDIQTLINKIKDICWIQLGEDWDERTDFSDECVLYYSIERFISDAFRQQNTISNVENKNTNNVLVYNHN